MTFTREERVKLLRAGFSGKQIERLYLILNSFEIVGVDWQGEAVTKLAGTELEVRTPPSEIIASFSRLNPLRRVNGSVIGSLAEV